MKRQYYNNTSMLDVLFNLLLGIFLFLIISIVHVVEEQSKADIETKAEFVITMTWDGDQNNDVDIWVLDPKKNLMWYRDQEVGVIHNDRDDKGRSDDMYEDGKWIRINQEIVTFRGVLEGEWVVNLHLYRIGDSPYDKEPTNVEITFIKLNPKAEILIKERYVMTKYWEEITVARFDMTAKGEVFNLTNEPPANLVQTRTKMPRLHPNVSGQFDDPGETESDADEDYSI